MPTVGDIHKLLTCEPKMVNEKASRKEVVEVMLSGSPIARSVYVVDDSGRLKGVITLGDVLKGIAVQKGEAHVEDAQSPFKLFQFSPFSIAKDIMGPAVFVTRDTKLQKALGKMVNRRRNELPVVDADRRVIGDLNAYELLKYL
jgi:CBS domain-containing protein